MSKVKNKTADKEKLTFVKDCFEQQIVLKGLCTDVECEYVEDDGEECEAYYCTCDCNGYTLNVKLQSFIEFDFLYSGNDIKFSLDDVFNVMDVNDFNDYFFECDYEDKQGCENIIDNVLSLIAKYDYYIRKAGEEANISRMTDMHSEDERLYNNDNVKLRDILKLSLLEMKLCKTKSEKAKNAYIKFVQKQQQKVGIDNKTKRFVEYLKSGYDIPDNQSEDDFSKYDKTALLCYIICDVIGLIIAFAVLFVDYSVISHQGVVIGINTVDYLFTVISGFCLGYILTRIFGTKLVFALTPLDNKDSAMNFRKKRFDDLDFADKIFQKYIAPALAFVIMIFSILIACGRVCIASDCVIEHNLIGDTQYKYEDVIVYLSKGVWEDDEYIKYDYPCYVFEHENEIIIETGEISDENTQRDIEKIFNDNAIEPQILDEKSQKLKELL